MKFKTAEKREKKYSIITQRNEMRHSGNRRNKRRNKNMKIIVMMTDRVSSLSTLLSSPSRIYVSFDSFTEIKKIHI